MGAHWLKITDSVNECVHSVNLTQSLSLI